MFWRRSKPRRSHDTAVDFWMSYSDLMAGLVLLFILLLFGALFVLKSRVESQQQKLEAERQRVQIIQERVETTQRKLEELEADVKKVLGVRAAILERIRSRFETVGGDIEFDDSTGAIRLGSDILFKEGSAKLTSRGQATLDNAMPIYLDALLGDPALAEHVDRISIEGHTNSNYGGSKDPTQAYLYNLRLSQNRAYNAMEYLLRSDLKAKRDLRRLLVANGFSSSRLIRDVKIGEEDKVRSRRIEIRFRLKDEEALLELKNMLQARTEEGG